MARRNRRPARAAVGLAVAALAAVVVLALGRLRRAVESARNVPLSPLAAGRRVGADYPERSGIVTDGEVDGEMDDMSEYAGPGFDPEAVHRAVRDFYERTSDYELAYRVRWHRPFRLGAALASRITARVEQLNLPGPGESGSGESASDGWSLAAEESAARELHSRFARVDPAADPRPGARTWVRARSDGEAVFVAIYAHHDRGDRRYVNIAVPLPGANLSTVLRPENLDPEAGDGPGGLELTTLGGPDGGDEGLYLATPLGNVALPLDQRFRVRPTEDAGRPAGVEATHEMWLFGRQFLTIRYRGRDGSSG